MNTWPSSTAFKPTKGKRFIQYMGHVKMMAATQPFLPGAISKTVNMPATATVEEIEDAYTQAWKLGLKAVAIYRDGSKSNRGGGEQEGKTKDGRTGSMPRLLLKQLWMIRMRRRAPCAIGCRILGQP